MSRFFKAILVLTVGLLIFSCNKDDDSNGAKPEPYDEQAPKDDAKIVAFLKEYHMDVDPVTYEVTFTKITPENGLSKIWDDPRLEDEEVEFKDVMHKYYFIKFREGTGTQPVKGDSVLVSYRGEYLYTKKEEILPSTNPKTYKEYIAGEQFDQAQNPVWFSLDLVIDGWKEMLPRFKSGTSSFDPATGVITYDNYGAGVFFIPSALGYYSASGTIPAYSPMVFSVKLMHVNRVDHDFDGIDSFDEDLNHDGEFKVVEGVDDNTIDDDSDDDGKADYRDQDDDGDGVLTKDERPGRVSIDTDGDGKPNYLDTDDDGDGIATAAEILRGDTDNDGTKNYLDTDDDGDGVLTVNEGTGDCNNNGVPNYLDPVVCP